MTFFLIFLFFIIFPNILLAFFLKNKKSFLNGLEFFLISFGVAPFLTGVMFYYLLFIFPQKKDLFYLSIILFFWFSLYLISKRNIKELFDFYKKTFNKLILIFKNISKINFTLFLFSLFFFFIFLCQAIFIPVVDNDSSIYINQSEALYESKDLNWGKGTKKAIIRGDDQIVYNKAVRPGIPSLIAASFLLRKSEYNYFPYQFQAIFYHIFLLLSFLYSIYLIKKKNVPFENYNFIYYGFFIFIFSWTLTRTFIYNAKESAICTFALLGIILLSKLINFKKEKFYLTFLLGLILGINSFINYHGTVIAIFIIFLFLLFSKLNFLKRIKQSIFILCGVIFFGGFEVFGYFSFISSPIRYYFNKIFLFLFPKNIQITKITGKKYFNFIPDEVKNNQLSLYQIKDIWDIYFKGKLQVLTKVGVFGFYFWIFLTSLFFMLKRIWRNKIIRIILFFMLVYFFVIIDPLNLNKNRYATILWGSSKYSQLLMLFGTVVTVSYIEELIEILYNIFLKINRFMFIILSIILLSLIFLHNSIVNFALKISLSVYPIYKSIDFYQNKIEFCFLITAFSVFIFLIISGLSIKYKNKFIRIFFILNLIVIFILGPFFIANVGKVPIKKTFDVLFYDKNRKLETTLFNGDIFEVYFYAKEKFPQKTKLKTDFKQVYLYDDYFSLARGKEASAQYYLSKDKCLNSEIIYSNKNAYLCGM